MEVAKKEGKSFAQWKKDLVSEFEKKAGVFGMINLSVRGIDGKLLADPKTVILWYTSSTEYNLSYKRQAAYSAARYQRMMDNIDHRPYGNIRCRR
ncbi:hypothetical protein [Pasteurella multocida]|uniref:hypothetical protein n=1 Tax=Pasteurella multocida TaxID=747 RepID=UPI001E434A0F|nr:hypothetical protein [Pasteurella multocida]